MDSISSSSLPRLAAGCMVVVSIVLAGCGSTTHIYSADKTLVYGDSVYNVSGAKVITARTDGVISDAETIDLKGTDKARFNDLLKQNGSVLVRQTISMDGRDLVYQAKSVSSWSDFDRMNKQFSSATASIHKFLADESQTQLKLK